MLIRVKEYAGSTGEVRHLLAGWEDECPHGDPCSAVVLQVTESDLVERPARVFRKQTGPVMTGSKRSGSGRPEQSLFALLLFVQK